MRYYLVFLSSSSECATAICLLQANYVLTLTFWRYSLINMLTIGCSCVLLLCLDATKGRLYIILPKPISESVHQLLSNLKTCKAPCGAIHEAAGLGWFLYCDMKCVVPLNSYKKGTIYVYRKGRIVKAHGSRRRSSFTMVTVSPLKSTDPSFVAPAKDANVAGPVEPKRSTSSSGAKMDARQENQWCG